MSQESRTQAQRNAINEGISQQATGQTARTQAQNNAIDHAVYVENQGTRRQDQVNAINQGIRTQEQRNAISEGISQQANMTGQEARTQAQRNAIDRAIYVENQGTRRQDQVNAIKQGVTEAEKSGQKQSYRSTYTAQTLNGTAVASALPKSTSGTTAATGVMATTAAATTAGNIATTAAATTAGNIATTAAAASSASGKSSSTASGKSSSTSSTTMKLDYTGINNMSKTIKEAKETLEKYWNDIKNTQIEKINQSWAAEEAKEYVNVVLDKGKKIESIIKVLNLLETTYEKVISQAQQTQTEVIRTISNSSN